MTKAEAFFLEAVQFVPVITLASSFIVGGGVDFSRAALLFVISALSAVIITAILAAEKVLLNPILLGTNLWLCAGALGFGVPISELADIIGQTQGFGLYICVFAVGILLTAATSTRFIGMRHPDRRTVRKLSFILLGVTAVIMIWSFFFIKSIRLGGALPFIALNVTRRMMIRRNRPVPAEGNTAP